VLATYAMGYNLLMGYAGLLSLGPCNAVRGPDFTERAQRGYLGFGPLRPCDGKWPRVAHFLGR